MKFRELTLSLHRFSSRGTFDIIDRRLSSRFRAVTIPYIVLRRFPTARVFFSHAFLEVTINYLFRFCNKKLTTISTAR